MTATITMATGQQFTVEATYDDAQAVIAAKQRTGGMHEFALADGGRVSVAATGVSAIAENTMGQRVALGFR